METQREDVHLQYLTVVVDKDEMKMGDNILDYRFRSSDPAFDELCLWCYVELAEKISLARDN
jgi:hypothetical protein